MNKFAKDKLDKKINDRFNAIGKSSLESIEYPFDKIKGESFESSLKSIKFPPLDKIKTEEKFQPVDRIAMETAKIDFDFGFNAEPEADSLEAGVSEKDNGDNRDDLAD